MAEASESTSKLAVNKGNWLTRAKGFRKLCKWAFDVCDSNGTGSINETELYAGFLLVHLNLAKYAGPAACYPPPRAVVDQLFVASDDDNSGGIDYEEFCNIMVILCSQITSRIAVYYGILILLVPYIASFILSVLDFIGVDDTCLKVDALFDTYAPSFLRWIVDLIPDETWNTLPDRLISLSLFFLVIPTMFNWIDEKSRTMAENTVVYGETETTTTTTTTTEATSEGSSEKKEE